MSILYTQIKGQNIVQGNKNSLNTFNFNIFPTSTIILYLVLFFWSVSISSFPLVYIILSSNAHIVSILHMVVIPMCHSITKNLAIQFCTWLTPQLTILKMLASVKANCKQLNYREFQGKKNLWYQFQKYKGKVERPKPWS